MGGSATFLGSLFLGLEIPDDEWVWGCISNQEKIRRMRQNEEFRLNVRVCLRPGTYHVLVLTELQWICRTGAQGDGSLLNALSRKCYMHTLQYVHRGTLP